MYDMVLLFYIPIGHDNTITKHTGSKLKFEKKCNSGKLHSLPQKLKSMFFEIFMNNATKEPACGLKKKLLRKLEKVLDRCGWLSQL